MQDFSWMNLDWTAIILGGLTYGVVCFIIGYMATHVYLKVRDTDVDD